MHVPSIEDEPRSQGVVRYPRLGPAACARAVPPPPRLRAGPGNREYVRKFLAAPAEPAAALAGAPTRRERAVAVYYLAQQRPRLDTVTHTLRSRGRQRTERDERGTKARKAAPCIEQTDVRLKRRHDRALESRAQRPQLWRRVEPRRSGGELQNSYELAAAGCALLLLPDSSFVYQGMSGSAG